VAVYLDSSALVKLVVREPDTAALRRYLRRHEERASCALARVEVLRAVRAHGAPAMTRARDVLHRVQLIRLDDTILDRAAAFEDAALRSLDAIHIAAALGLEADLSALVTYDQRMARAARALGLSVEAPA
jgi:hypothetical protein